MSFRDHITVAFRKQPIHIKTIYAIQVYKHAEVHNLEWGVALVSHDHVFFLNKRHTHFQ